MNPTDYAFQGGYPTRDTVQKAYDVADLNRAIQAYRFFYPSVSIVGTWKGNEKGGPLPTGCSDCSRARHSNWSSLPSPIPPMQV